MLSNRLIRKEKVYTDGSHSGWRFTCSIPNSRCKRTFNKRGTKPVLEHFEEKHPEYYNVIFLSLINVVYISYNNNFDIIIYL